MSNPNTDTLIANETDWECNVYVPKYDSRKKSCPICLKMISVSNFNKHLGKMHNIHFAKNSPPEIRDYTLFCCALQYLNIDESLLHILLYRAPLIFSQIYLTRSKESLTNGI